MKVLFKKNLTKIGAVGDVKEVTEGYARNFLIPRGIAVIVNKHEIDAAHAQRNKLAKQQLVSNRSRIAALEKYKNRKFSLAVPADEKGSLYAKISKKAILAFFKENGLVLDETELINFETIKKIGDYRFNIKADNKNVEFNIKVVSQNNN